MQATYRVDALHYHAQVRLAQQSAPHLAIDRYQWQDVLEHHSTILRFHEADHSAPASSSIAPTLPPLSVRMQLGLRLGVDSALVTRLRAPDQPGSTDRQMRLQRMVTCRLRLIACSELQSLADGYEAGASDPRSTPDSRC